MTCGSSVDWVEVLADLKSEGVSQVTAAAIVGSAQTTLSDLSRGKTKEPVYSLGVRLLALWDLVKGRVE